MYAICDVRWHLSDSFCFYGSESESLVAFASYYPPPRSVLVYRVDGKDHGSFIFIDHISSRRFKRLVDNFRLHQRQPEQRGQRASEDMFTECSNLK